MYIYRIYNDDKSYIGSTVNVKNRMWHHKNNKNRCSAKLIIDSGSYNIEILEECNKDNRLEREQYWMDKYDNLVNVNRARDRHDRRWDKEHKKEIILYKKNRHQYINSWGGDPRTNNNLWKIDINIFLK